MREIALTGLNEEEALGLGLFFLHLSGFVEVFYQAYCGLDLGLCNLEIADRRVGVVGEADAVDAVGGFELACGYEL